MIGPSHSTLMGQLRREMIVTESSDVVAGGSGVRAIARDYEGRDLMALLVAKR